MVALFGFLFVLAALIHFILLSTDRFNWLDSRSGAPAAAGLAVPAAPDGLAVPAAPDATTPGMDLPTAPATALTIPEGEGLVADTVDGAPKLTVYFDTGKATVSNQLASESAALKAHLDANPEARLSVSGYVDPRGGAAMNAELAKNRAQAVKAALAAAGIADDRIDLDKPADIVAGSQSLTNDRKVEVTVR